MMGNKVNSNFSTTWSQRKLIYSRRDNKYRKIHTSPKVPSPTLDINTLLPVYDMRVKIFSSGRVEFRKYSSAMGNIKTDREVSGIKLVDDVTGELIGKKRAPKKSGLQELRQDNVARTVTTIKDYGYENKNLFKSFITLTFSENICDVSEANKKFKNWVDQIRRLCKKHGQDFYYLGVPEFQKRGAVHYHLLTSLEPGGYCLPVQLDNMGVVHSSYSHKYKKHFTSYDVKYWEGVNGYSSALDFNECDENFDAIKYMIKYLLKDLDQRLFGHKKILASNNLTKPKVLKTLSDVEVLKELQQMLELNQDMKKESYNYVPTKDQSYITPFTEIIYEPKNYRTFNNELNSVLVHDCTKLRLYDSTDLAF